MSKSGYRSGRTFTLTRIKPDRFSLLISGGTPSGGFGFSRGAKPPLALRFADAHAVVIAVVRLVINLSRPRDIALDNTIG
jgi:hypothetical protein